VGPSSIGRLALLLLVVGCGPSGGGDGGPPDFASNGPNVIPGAADRMLLIGTLLTPDRVIDGQVLVEGATITCFGAGTECASAPGAAGATIVDTRGIIAPGFIDTHNHILFDIFDNDDWTPAQLYTNHTQWTSEARYAAMLDVKQCLSNDAQGKPTWCANTPYGTSAGSLRCEMDKFGELKGLIAGTTSIVGLAGTAAACFGSVARSIDTIDNGLGQDHIQTSSVFPPSRTSADGVCTNFASGYTTAYLIHCGEGADATALAEYGTLGSVTTTPDCLLAPQTAITHGTAFAMNEFASMAQHGMKLIWSPASNVYLYGKTADIPLARAAGLTVALAPDWSMGGSQNLLDELRFADAWDNADWNDVLTAKDLLLMVTENAAEALALGDRLGRIEVGYYADLVVFAGDRAAPYDAVLAATPAEVELVMVGGRVLYGDQALVAASSVPPICEAIDVCGLQKFLCLAMTSTSDKFNQTFNDVKTALDQALTAVDAQTPSDGWSFAPLAPLVKCR
jgi:cytosine/adenosine deaminase-related metal-dependent hydrolase